MKTGCEVMSDIRNGMMESLLCKGPHDARGWAPSHVVVWLWHASQHHMGPHTGSTNNMWRKALLQRHDLKNKNKRKLPKYRKHKTYHLNQRNWYRRRLMAEDQKAYFWLKLWQNHVFLHISTFELYSAFIFLRMGGCATEDKQWRKSRWESF